MLHYSKGKGGKTDFTFLGKKWEKLNRVVKSSRYLFCTFVFSDRDSYVPALPSSFLTQLLPSFGESELSFGSKASAHSWQYLSHQGVSPLPVKVA